MPGAGKKLIAAILAGGLAAAALAKDPPSPAKGPGSKVRQIMLLQAIDKLYEGTLVAELNRNKNVYLAMNPEQRRALREQVLLYLKENPDRQVELLKTAQEFLKLTPAQQQAFREREEWLQQVLHRLSAEELKELKSLPPAERAARLLDLKAEMEAEEASTAPVDAEAPAPAAAPAPALAKTPTTTTAPDRPGLLTVHVHTRTSPEAVSP